MTEAFKVCNFEADFSQSENCDFDAKDGEVKVTAYRKPTLRDEKNPTSN